MFTPFAFVKQAGGGGLAAQFIAASGVTGSAIITALNDLEAGLTTYNLNSKMLAVYPMVGGNSTTTKYNFMDTTKFQIGWTGSVVFASTGVNKTAANMQTAWGNTGLTPTASLTLNDTHMAYYSRTQLTPPQIDALTGILYPSEMGTDWASSRYDLEVSSGPSSFFWCRAYKEGEMVTTSQANSTGFFITSRTSSSNLTLYWNGSQRGSTYSGAQTSTFSGATGGVFILGEGTAANAINVGTIRECAFATIGMGLSGTDAANLYTVVQAFQTTLGRQV